MKNQYSKGFRRSVMGMVVALVSITGCGGEETMEPSGQPSEVSGQAVVDSAYLNELFPVRQDAYDPRIQHQAPSVPIMVEGVQHPPASISRFNGRSVIYLMNKESQEGGFVYVFANHQQLRKHLEARGQMPGAESSGVTVMNPYPASFREHADFGGAELNLSPGSSISNLKDRFLFWPVTWNDAISSVLAATEGTHTVLYQNSNYWGNEVWLAAGTYNQDLSWINFDNQASSIRVLN